MGWIDLIVVGMNHIEKRWLNRIERRFNDGCLVVKQTKMVVLLAKNLGFMLIAKVILREGRKSRIPGFKKKMMGLRLVWLFTVHGFDDLMGCLSMEISWDIKPSMYDRLYSRKIVNWWEFIKAIVIYSDLNPKTSGFNTCQYYLIRN